MKYTVRIEIETRGTDFAEIVVEAESKEQARILAGELHGSEDCPELDYWASNHYESSLDTQFQKDWEVEELPPELDKDALIADLAQEACDGTDIKSLVTAYYDNHVEYLERMTEEELVDYAKEYGNKSAAEIKEDY